MKKRYTKFAALLAALSCISGTVSCGRDVPTVDNSSRGDFSLAGGNGDNSDFPEKSGSATSADGTENTAPLETQTTAGGNISIVTRSKDEIDKINTHKPSGGSSSTTRPSGGGSSGGNSSGGGQSSSGSGNSGVSGITLSYYTAELVVGQTKGYPVVSETINEVWTSSDTNVAIVDGMGNITAVGEGSCIIRVTSAENSKIGAEVTVTVKKADGVQVIDGITYVDSILIANKSYALPSTYNPGGLTNDTYSAFQELVQGAANDGLNIFLSSGFRSYESQEQIYNNYVYTHGQATADTFSARPGYSEHQTGMAIDVNEISDAFIGTSEAIWLEENCYDYGFIIRYPKGKQDVTGYKYEPWHIRYVGKDVASAFRETANAVGDPYLTLEEYLGIDSYYH